MSIVDCSGFGKAEMQTHLRNPKAMRLSLSPEEMKIVEMRRRLGQGQTVLTAMTESEKRNRDMLSFP